MYRNSPVGARFVCSIGRSKDDFGFAYERRKEHECLCSALLRAEQCCVRTRTNTPLRRHTLIRTRLIENIWIRVANHFHISSSGIAARCVSLYFWMWLGAVCVRLVWRKYSWNRCNSWNAISGENTKYIIFAPLTHLRSSQNQFVLLEVIFC